MDVVLLPISAFSGRESSGACPAEGRVGFADAAMRENRQVLSHALDSLVYTPFADYNAQDVGPRTLVRASAGMPRGRHGRGGLPGLEPGPPRGRPIPRRGRAQAPPRSRRGGTGHAAR